MARTTELSGLSLYTGKMDSSESGKYVWDFFTTLSWLMQSRIEYVLKNTWDVKIGYHPLNKFGIDLEAKVDNDTIWTRLE